MAENEFTRFRREYKSDMRQMEKLMREHTTHVNGRLADIGQQLIRVAAESEERWNQLFGRMRLQEGRFTAFLGATDKLYGDLERRVSDIESRLGPPAA